MAQSPVLLEYKFSPGDILTYRSSTNSVQEITQAGRTNSQQNIVEMVMQWKIIDFLNNLYKIEISVKSGSLTKDGVTEKLPPIDKSSFVTMKKSGQVISEQSSEAQIAQQAFPEHAIETGLGWKTEMKFNYPGKPEPILLTYTYTLGGFENASGFDCAKIAIECPDSSYDLQNGFMLEAKANGFVDFAVSEGLLVKSQLKIDNKLVSQQAQMRSENTVIMELVELNGKAIG